MTKRTAAWPSDGHDLLTGCSCFAALSFQDGVSGNEWGDGGNCSALPLRATRSVTFDDCPPLPSSRCADGAAKPAASALEHPRQAATGLKAKPRSILRKTCLEQPACAAEEHGGVNANSYDMSDMSDEDVDTVVAAIGDTPGVPGRELYLAEQMRRSAAMDSTQDSAVAASTKAGTAAEPEWKGQTLLEHWRCTELMMTVPDCDDCGQLMDHGGDDAPLRHKGKEPEVKVPAVGSVSGTKCAAYFEAKCVQALIDSTQEDTTKHTRMTAVCRDVSDETTTGTSATGMHDSITIMHMKKKINAIDGNIYHGGTGFDVAGLEGPPGMVVENGKSKADRPVPRWPRSVWNGRPPDALGLCRGPPVFRAPRLHQPCARAAWPLGYRMEAKADKSDGTCCTRSCTKRWHTRTCQPLVRS